VNQVQQFQLRPLFSIHIPCSDSNSVFQRGMYEEERYVQKKPPVFIGVGGKFLVRVLDNTGP